MADHRLLFSIRAMCRCLRVQPSGFYAWLKDPLSKRAQEDQRQTALIRAAWRESGKVYGHRKLHDDLAEPVSEPGREVLSQPGCTADVARRHPGADRLHAPPRPLWRQAIPGGRQHARSPF